MPGGKPPKELDYGKGCNNPWVRCRPEKGHGKNRSKKRLTRHQEDWTQGRKVPLTDGRSCRLHEKKQVENADQTILHQKAKLTVEAVVPIERERLKQSEERPKPGGGFGTERALNTKCKTGEK